MDLTDVFARSHAVVLDFDSTLVTIEGIDELASLHGVANEVKALTHAAMQGDIDIHTIFAKRLELIRPQLSELHALSTMYKSHITEGAIEFISLCTRLGKKVFVVSGGFFQAISPVTTYIGIPEECVYANTLHFTSYGTYAGFDVLCPLWKGTGKVDVLLQIKKMTNGIVLMIGDGITDYETKEVVDNFFCFTGVVSRKNVVQKSSYICSSFYELLHPFDQRVKNDSQNC